MLCLAIDTSGTSCSVCLYDSDTDIALASKSEALDRGHAEHLMDFITYVMERADKGFGDLERIITTTGPGSFTGIRVAIATAKGFGLGLSIPVIGISNLAAMLEISHKQTADHRFKRLGVVMDAGRGFVYGLFDTDTPFAKSGNPFISPKTELMEFLDQENQSGQADQLFVAYSADNPVDGLEDLTPVILIALPTIPIEVIARLGGQKAAIGKAVEPLYLRQPDAAIQSGFAVKRAG